MSEADDRVTEVAELIAKSMWSMQLGEWPKHRVEPSPGDIAIAADLVYRGNLVINKEDTNK